MTILNINDFCKVIIIALLVGMLSAAFLLLMHKCGGWGTAGWMIRDIAAMRMIIGGINFIFGNKVVMA